MSRSKENIVEVLILIFTIALVAFCLWYVNRPTMDEVGIPYIGKSSDSDDKVRVRWLGITSLLIEDGETQILTDGFFSRPGALDLIFHNKIEPDPLFIQNSLRELDVDRLRVVIPVHSHYDHAMDSAIVADITGATILGSESTANIARSFSLPEAQITIAENGKKYQFGQFTVTLIESRHAPLATNSGIDGRVTRPFKLPAPYTAWQLGKAYSILIEHGEERMLIQGSAGFLPGALKDTRADVVFLGVGGLKNLSKDYQINYINEVVKPLNPSLVIPIHHDDLFGDYGEVKQNPLMLEFDRSWATLLTSLVHPAQLRQMRFAEATAIFNEVEDSIGLP